MCKVLLVAATLKDCYEKATHCHQCISTYIQQYSWQSDWLADYHIWMLFYWTWMNFFAIRILYTHWRLVKSFIAIDVVIFIWLYRCPICLLRIIFCVNQNLQSSKKNIRSWFIVILSKLTCDSLHFSFFYKLDVTLKVHTIPGNKNWAFFSEFSPSYSFCILSVVSVLSIQLDDAYFKCHWEQPTMKT